MILHGDSLERLKELDDCSIDAVVTDPPYGLGNTSPKIVAECLRAWSCGETWAPSGRGGFMGKSWDAWVPPPELWREVFRVMKHGAHALVFASSRTQDLMSISLRLAGFEVRDTLQWLYGSGFPKSHNVALGIDKLHGYSNRGRAIPVASRYQASDIEELNKLTSNPVEAYSARSELAEPWEGWGTALKPAYEPAILVRKPLDGTIANNVLAHGTGALNIDATRVGDESTISTHRAPSHFSNGVSVAPYTTGSEKGRWPANVIIDDHVAEMLDDQVKSNVSRFFYSPKASKREREAGLVGREKRRAGGMMGRHNGSLSGAIVKRANTHPTVKPLDLMRYLVRLITPPDGVVLDPFAGSGSTLCAGALEGFRVIGIEREAEYVEIARARLAHWSAESAESAESEKDQLSLFGD